MSDIKGCTSTISNIFALHKELDEASCPICMDHPHNAVLLLCSSHDKGCRSYVCDTSYRHSNCFDRLKNLSVDHRNSHASPRNPALLRLGQTPLSVHASEMNSGVRTRIESSEAPETLGESDNQDPYEFVENQDGGIVETSGSESVQYTIALDESRSGNLLLQEPNLDLKCPLCRGTVHGWKIVKEARQYLDLKHRSCSQESCSFTGNYRELRRHARRVHPTTRPADINPSRESAWQRLEHQREYGDIVMVKVVSRVKAVAHGGLLSFCSRWSATVAQGGPLPSQEACLGFGHGIVAHLEVFQVKGIYGVGILCACKMMKIIGISLVIGEKMHLGDQGDVGVSLSPDPMNTTGEVTPLSTEDPLADQS